MKHRHPFAVFMSTLLPAVLVLSAWSPRPVEADGPPVSGTYLLTQADGFLQLLTLTANGNAFRGCLESPCEPPEPLPLRAGHAARGLPGEAPAHQPTHR
jgi:hypothetical protein